jgi:hypothetical protein
MKRSSLTSLVVLATTWTVMSGCVGIVGGSTTGGGGSGTGGAGGPGPVTPPSGHPRILFNAANLARVKGQLSGPDAVPVANSFVNMVDRQVAGADQYGFMAWFAALLYQLTGDAKYGTFAVSTIDAKVAAEEALIAEGDEPDAAFDSYLEVGEIIGDVALVYDWCNELLTAQQKQRWLAYANQGVWNIWNPNMARWGDTEHSWSGWSITNPGNNYYSSFLEATLLLGLATQGDDPAMSEQWMDMYRNAKIRDELIPTFDTDLEGGGSREGTGYGELMKRLFKQYDIWAQSTGEHIAALTPHTEGSFFWMVHATAPTLDRIVTTGDQGRESTGVLFDYHREYVQTILHLFPQSQFAPMGQYYLNHSSVPQMDQDYDYALDVLYHHKNAPETPLAGLYPAYYSKGAGNVFVRSSWSTDATWLTFIAGPYSESHAHRDQGSFTIYKNEWLAYEQVVNSMSGLRREEAVHNIPGVTVGSSSAQMRNHEGQLVALADNAQYTHLANDATAYYQGAGGIMKMERELVFVKPDTFIVFDRVQAQAGAQKVWRMNTPIRPAVAGGVATMAGRVSKLTLRPVLPSGTTPAVVEWATADSDSRGGFRVDITASGDGPTYFLNVLSVNDSVSAVADASAGGMQGAMLTLADGRTVAVRFADTGFGGMLDITGGSAPAVHATLSASVATLPRYAN